MTETSEELRQACRTAARRILRYVQARRTAGCNGCGIIGVDWDWAMIIESALKEAGFTGQKEEGVLKS